MPSDITTLTANDALGAAHMNNIKTWVDFLVDALPTRALRLQSEATPTVGSAFSITAATSQALNMLVYQSTPADANQFTHSVVLAPGTYTMYVLGAKLSSAGLIDWVLDGDTIATGQDWYAGSATYNQVQSVGSIVLTDGGNLVLEGTINGKNASSSGYDMRLTAIWFKQAAD